MRRMSKRDEVFELIKENAVDGSISVERIYRYVLLEGIVSRKQDVKKILQQLLFEKKITAQHGVVVISCNNGERII